MIRLLGGAEIDRLLSPALALDAVEQSLRLRRKGEVEAPPPLSLHGASGGGFHAKAAALHGATPRAALKFNANFPDNPARGLPTIQGVLILCDGGNGSILALLDSIALTRRRTAAASALAARCLAPAHSSRLALVGCGAQGAPHLEALRAVLPALAEVRLWDTDEVRAHALAAAVRPLLGRTVDIQVATGLRDATMGADVVLTCTSARAPYLGPDEVAKGSLVLAVGADHPHKNEIAPALMAISHVVVDDLDQCLAMGDLHHAVASGLMARERVHAALVDLLDAPVRNGIDGQATVIFDSTGLGLFDVACAAVVWERALQMDAGMPLTLS